MTLPEELVQPAAEVLLKSAYGPVTLEACCDVVQPLIAAVLRALPKSEVVVEAGARENATLDGSAVLFGHYRAEARRVILGIAKLADDV